MYKIKTTRRFEKDVVICIQRNYDIEILNEILTTLENKGVVDSKYKPHKLKGDMKGYWECHLKPDWLLIWKLDSKFKEILLIRSGTHSDLFG